MASSKARPAASGVRRVGAVAGAKVLARHPAARPLAAGGLASARQGMNAGPFAMLDVFGRPLLDTTSLPSLERATGLDPAQLDAARLHRHIAARELCRGKDVLALAVGEERGTALLAEVARSLAVADTQPWASEPTGAGALPYEGGSVDVVVALDVLAHLDAPDPLLVEIRRVLRADGMLIISMPLGDVTSIAEGSVTPERHPEARRAAFEGLLSRHFVHQALWLQRPASGSVLLRPATTSALPCVVDHRNDRGEIIRSDTLPDATHLVGVASDQQITALPSRVYIDTSTGGAHPALPQQVVAAHHSELAAREIEIARLSAELRSTRASVGYRVHTRLRAALARAARLLRSALRHLGMPDAVGDAIYVVARRILPHRILALLAPDLAVRELEVRPGPIRPALLDDPQREPRAAAGWPLRHPLPSSALPLVDLACVTFDSAQQLDGFFRSLLAQNYPLDRIRLLLVDHGSSDDTVMRMEAFRAAAGARFHALRIFTRPQCGFGDGRNWALGYAEADFLLVADVDLTFEADALVWALSQAMADGPRVGAWEFRQKPYEQSKFYDPLTLETAWCSQSCILFRTAALQEVGGFGRLMSMHAEDVELFYRLRSRGWHLHYVPRAVAWQRAAETPGPRCRADAAETLDRWAGRIGAQRVKDERQFGAVGLDDELHQPFPFTALKPMPPQPRPRVSILMRTHGERNGWRREAIRSVLAQTYDEIELVLVEDGGDRAAALVNDLRRETDLPILYEALPKVGRSAAGNRALDLATGRYLTFLDDDDLLLADHIETLVNAIRDTPDCRLVYSQGWEVVTEVHSVEPLRYDELRYSLLDIAGQPFSRDLMRTRNPISIQSALFDRSLYEAAGGFDEELAFMEDWNLWLRYSRLTDFLAVPKVTSLYRTPADAGQRAARQALMAPYNDVAYRRAMMAPLDIRLLPRAG